MKNEEYVSVEHNLKVHFASLIGRAGQDNNFFGMKPDVQTADDAAKFLSSAYSDIDLNTKECLKMGSCGISAMITPDGFLTIANVGDSDAKLYADGEMVWNNPLHDLSSTDELLRIRAAQGFVYFGRVCGVLAVTRSFGDESYKGVDGDPLIISEPSLFKLDLKDDVFKGQKLILEVSCDGLRDHTNVDDRKEIITGSAENKALALVKKCEDNSPQTLYRTDTKRDDVTVFLVEIDINKLANLQGGLLCSVFDGHGKQGEKVSAKAVEIMKGHSLEKNAKPPQVEFVQLPMEDLSSSESSSLSDKEAEVIAVLNALENSSTTSSAKALSSASMPSDSETADLSMPASAVTKAPSSSKGISR